MEWQIHQIRGATKAIAERLGISEAAVSYWRKRGIPERRKAVVAEVLAEMNAPPPAPAPQPEEAA